MMRTVSALSASTRSMCLIATFSPVYLGATQRLDECARGRAVVKGGGGGRAGASETLRKSSPVARRADDAVTAAPDHLRHLVLGLARLLSLEELLAADRLAAGHLGSSCCLDIGHGGAWHELLGEHGDQTKQNCRRLAGALEPISGRTGHRRVGSL
eukprot:SAG31_NODE_872_length_11329_cov_3.968655_14_plen_156_part_00